MHWLGRKGLVPNSRSGEPLSPAGAFHYTSFLESCNLKCVEQYSSLISYLSFSLTTEIQCRETKRPVYRKTLTFPKNSPESGWGKSFKNDHRCRPLQSLISMSIVSAGIKLFSPQRWLDENVLTGLSRLYVTSEKQTHPFLFRFVMDSFRGLGIKLCSLSLHVIIVS